MCLQTSAEERERQEPSGAALSRASESAPAVGWKWRRANILGGAVWGRCAQRMQRAMIVESGNMMIEGTSMVAAADSCRPRQSRRLWQHGFHIHTTERTRDKVIDSFS